MFSHFRPSAWSIILLVISHLASPLVLAETPPKPQTAEERRRERQRKKEEEERKKREDEIKADVDRLGFSRAPYVQLALPTSIRVVWRTVKDMQPEVRIGASPHKLDRRIAGLSILKKRISKDKLKNKEAAKLDPKPLHSGPKNTTQFEATVEGLEPDTRYYYGIFDGDRRLTPPDQTYYFRTNPRPGSDREAYFWVVGDSGTGERRQEQVYEGMLSYNAHVGRPLDFYVHVGDMAYGAGKDDQFTKGFFRVYEKTLRNTVVWPAMGNHEGTTAEGPYGVGPYYDAYVSPTRGEAGGLASGTESYYSWDYGQVHFIVLNSFDESRSASGPMAQWLKEDLARTKANWIVGYWHHPPYTKGSHDSDKEKELVEMRENILPILEAGGVDVVFTGHSHIYERSMLIDGAYATPTKAANVVFDDGDGDPNGDGPYRKSLSERANQGSVHVVTGNGGTGLGRKGTSPIMRRVMVEHGSVLAHVKGDTFSAIMVNYLGEPRDHWQIVKQPGVTPTRIAKPRELPSYVPPGADMPAHYAEVMQKGAEWRYLAGGDPPTTWTQADFDDKEWKKGKAGFGYGDKDDKTELDDMDGRYHRVYARNEFEVAKGDDLKKMGLAIRYDDAFIAYLNGKEFLRVGIGKGAGAEAEEIGDHEAEDKFEYFAFGKAAEFLKEGKNVLAIEGHTINSDEGDFTLDPYVILAQDAPRRRDVRPLYTSVMGPDAPWRFTVETPGENWFAASFNDGEWELGPGGFGYGLDLKQLVKTDTKDLMKDKARVLYTRTKFRIESEEDIARMGLSMLWDDGFIAYLNGQEVARDGVGLHSGAKAARLVYSKDANRAYFPFSRWEEHLRVGENVLAIEGHNYSADSDDFALVASVIKPWTNLGDREAPKHFAYVLPKDAEWQYLAGKDAEPGWNTRVGEDPGWEIGPAPIGFGVDDLETKLDKMKDKYSRVYLRQEFEVAKEEDKKDFGLLLSWNDAFIAYLNGQEIFRVGVEEGSGASASGVYRVVASSQALTRYFPFKKDPPPPPKEGEQVDEDGQPVRGRGRGRWQGEPVVYDFTSLLQVGKNVLAIEGHNYSARSGTFALGPAVIRAIKPAKREDLPPSFIPIIAEKSDWQYLAGGEPEANWTTHAQASGPEWKKGPVPIGYKESAGTIELETRVTDMQDHYTTLYLRNVFTLASEAETSDLALAMKWDDGFIAYLNGQEIIRENVPNGSGAKASGVAKVDAGSWKIFPFNEFKQHLRVGENVLCIEGHNESKDSSDFLIDSYLLRVLSTKMPKEFTPLIPQGSEWAYWADAKAPEEHWETLKFDDVAWKRGQTPLGYDDEKDPKKAYANATDVAAMKGATSKAYLRRKFSLSSEELAKTGLGLAIRYDDGFIAYLNGKEIVNVGVGSTVTGHESTAEFDFFALDRFREELKPGENVIAIEIRNDKLDSSDLTVDPMLIWRK